MNTVTIDLESHRLVFRRKDEARTIDLYSREAFEIISEIWLKVGWNEKYVYTFSWFGRPIIQLPEDIIRIQEVIYRVKPDVIIETGCRSRRITYLLRFTLQGNRTRPGDRSGHRDPSAQPAAIEAHELASYITLVEGSSTDPEIVSSSKAEFNPASPFL